MFTIDLNPTITGGTPTTLTQVGLNPRGGYRWVLPTHTYLEPNTVEMTANSPVTTATDAGTASCSLKITRGSRVTEAGCCGVTTGQAIWDIRGRNSLNQPASTLVESLAVLRAVVNEPGLLESLLGSGAYPQ